MINLALQPLLQKDEGKDFTGAIIFFVIWGVIALLSQYGKWQQKKREREQMQPPPVPPTVPMQRPRAVPQPRAQAPQRPKPQAQRQKRSPQAAALPPRRPTVPRELSVEIAKLAAPSVKAALLASEMTHEIGAASEKTRFKGTVSAQDIRNDLHDPRTLRKQFIVMELLQPPLGQRDQH